jgi:hypothetical protein
MQFKYDQNLDIPNGIHAAIRGKLLECTFAPVWVEPLECSVMGGGYGEPGSTTAQTFAISTISGRKVKRLCMQVDTSPQLSSLLIGYYKLYDACVAFVNEFAPVRKEFDTFINTAAAAPSFQLTQQFKQSILHLFPKYQKLRMEQRDLERIPVPAGANITDAKERELMDSIDRIKGAVDGKMYYEQGGVTQENTVDAYIKYCVYAASSLPDGTYGEALRLTNSVSVGYLEIVSTLTNVQHRDGFMADDILASSATSMQLFRGVQALPLTLWAAAKIVQKVAAVDAMNDMPTRNTVDPIRVSSLTQFSNAIIGTDKRKTAGTASELLYQRMGVFATPLLALDSGLMNLGINVGSSVSDAVGQFFTDVPRLYNTERSDYARIGAINVGAPQNKVFLDCLISSMAASRATIEEQRELDVRHMMGAYVGSMFAQSIIQSALQTRGGAIGSYTAVHTVTDAVERTTRTSMLSSAYHMIQCGIILYGRMGLANFVANAEQAKFTLAMYLTHLSMMDYFQAQNAGLAQVGTTEAEVNARLGDLRNLPIDLQAICTKSLASAASLQAFVGANRVVHMRGLYPAVLGNNYMSRKLDARTVTADPGVTGFTAGTDLMYEILQAITDAARTTRTFDIIRKAVYDLDRQTTADQSTHTASAFEPGDGDGSGSSEGILHISADAAAAGESKTQQASSLSLGSILLDSSEQLSGGTGEEMDASATSPTPSDKQTQQQQGKQRSGASAASSSAKGQFKKVQAKLL